MGGGLRSSHLIVLVRKILTVSPLSPAYLQNLGTIQLSCAPRWRFGVLLTLTRPDFFFFSFNGFFSPFHRVTSKGIFFFFTQHGTVGRNVSLFRRLFPGGFKGPRVAPLPRLVTVCAKKRSGVSDKNTSPSTSELRLPKFLRKKKLNKTNTAVAS